MDEVVKVSEEDAGQTAKLVNQLEGIPVGISSGATLRAALQVAARPENRGKQIVAIAPSCSERYLSSWLYSDISVDSDEELLRPLFATQTPNLPISVPA